MEFGSARGSLAGSTRRSFGKVKSARLTTRSRKFGRKARSARSATTQMLEMREGKLWRGDLTYPKKITRAATVELIRMRVPIQFGSSPTKRMFASR
jgi:hypothetical protein